ncbi:MAG: methionine aminotransferase [Proteobacteria bacterium]|nr:methionine aminotransferase [Pseudomonadota bacterium]MDA1300028.1 methionine aminotransferase [Pseudomonadota bacterium]
MSKMAADHGAINLSQGYPDFDVPGPLLDAFEKYLRGGYNQYPPMSGIARLREQIALKVQRLYHATVDSETEITVTSGATEALFVAVQAIVGPGDEVIVFDPAYDCYQPAVTLAGGKTVHVPLIPGTFTIDHDRLAAAVNDRTRLIIVNSPHNPCGSTLSADDLNRLATLVEARDLLVISDEVYEHMVFDGKRHLSLLTSETLRARTFVVSSFGKTCHATGWKVAYCIAPPELTGEFRKVHQFVTFTTHTPTQWALADFMEFHPEHYLELPAFYQRKRDLFASEMVDSGFTLTPSSGTYFQLADYSALSDEPDSRFVERLTREVGVAGIPVSVFYEEPPEQRIVRFCFAKSDETLRNATAKLRAMAPD